MTTGRLVSLIIGVILIIIALVYLIAPQAIGGPLKAGELAPQVGMPGGKVSFPMTTIPIGVMDITLPLWSAIAMFAICGIALVLVALAARPRTGGA
ncbi:MAG: hypothetical protein M1136_02095 [Chloroflexi bacterium]|nr:hypothetical protein [Chloroflexota bacterium]MCL5074429.1 hypothetical protein [Chloroflexota bacterium]